jgi:hypothetical protein
MSRPTPQEIQDIRDQDKIEKAYDDASTSEDRPVLSGMGKTKQTYVGPNPSQAGAGRGRVNPPVPKSARYAGGGVTRADGCITKGHTRGKMV